MRGKNSIAKRRPSFIEIMSPMRSDFDLLPFIGEFIALALLSKIMLIDSQFTSLMFPKLPTAVSFDRL